MSFGQPSNELANAIGETIERIEEFSNMVVIYLAGEEKPICISGSMEGFICVSEEKPEEYEYDYMIKEHQ